MKKHYRKENDCLNCAAELHGKFCHNCGQENLQIRESFGHMLNHAVSDYFHFDHQFFHTLKPLLFQPGKLTSEYLNGRRAQYLHPVKMYIFVSVVFFLLILKSSHHANAKEGVNERAKQKTEVRKYTYGSSVANINFADPGNDSTLAAYYKRQNSLPANKRDDFVDRYIAKVKFGYAKKYGQAEWAAHFWEDVLHNIPKMMFVLLPIFALILKLAFWKNRKYYVEYLIYAIHLHCFYFLFSGTILLIQLLLPSSWDGLDGWLTALLFIYTIYYIYRSLRNLYQRSRWRTISKMIGISLSYWIFFGVCFIGLMAVTAAAMV